MRHLRKRLLAGAAGLALIGGTMVALAPGAEAQSVEVGAVAFSGCTQNLDPVLPVGPNTGGYGFNDSSHCGPANALGGVCVSAAQAPGADPTDADCEIAANGTYTNLVCGTGYTGNLTDETDVADVIHDADEGDPDPGAVKLRLEYGIVFVAGVGVFHGSGTDIGWPDPHPGPNGSGATGPAVGVIEIFPTQGTCATPVTQFAAQGVGIIAALV